MPLLQRSLQLWKELNQTHLARHTDATPLLTLCGGLMIGSQSSCVIQGTRASIEAYDLPHEVLCAAEIRRRFPVFEPRDDDIGLFEVNAGYLVPELCIDLYTTLAEELSAKLHYGEKFSDYVAVSGEEDLLRVRSDQGEYLTRKLVLTCGAWAHALYGTDIPVPLTLHRKVLFWFDPKYDNEEQRKLLTPAYEVSYLRAGHTCAHR